MSLVSENIKYLRKLNGLTQEDLAEKVGIKRPSIGSYEEGRAKPKISTLAEISKFFNIPVDMIINCDLIKLSLDELYAMASESKEKKLKILSITVDDNDEENIDLIPQKAAAGYLNGYADPEYIKELPKIKLPMLPRNATYRAFEILGDSMLPIESGTVIVGQYVEKLAGIKNGKTYILVTGKEGVVFKRVFNDAKENGKIFLVSDNKTYPPYEIPAEELIEIWEAKAYISINFPDPEDKENQSLSELTKAVMNLQKDVSHLKGK